MYKFLAFPLFFSFQLIAFSQTTFTDQESTLSQRWETQDSTNSEGKLFRIAPYKPIYLIFANFTTDINDNPVTETQSIPNPLFLKDVELKYQISLKTKVARNLLGKEVGGNLWLSYTQIAKWQVYNDSLSRPFRDVNYQPELMFVLPTPYSVLGLSGVYTALGIAHSSNGRNIPLSRSWNYFFAEMGWESKNLNVILRPWWRFSLSNKPDDNPGIENYVGRTELIMAYKTGRHNFDFQGRHSLRFDNRNRGSVQLGYAYRVYENLKIYAQLFHGYGDTLIDFNHKQTTFGIGISLIEWR